MEEKALGRRIQAITQAAEEVRGCYKRIRIRDYLFGQAVYNLGDYPARVYSDITDYDREQIRLLAQSGVQLIQLHEDWNDACRLYGADKFSSSDPQGLRNFVDYCHSWGIKVIAYVSTGYLHEPDPDFREEFAPSKEFLASLYFKYRKCDLGHPAWRKYITEKTLSAMDAYGFDGIYNDWGYAKYDPILGDCCIPDGFYDPQLEDALGEIYSKIKSRGGIYKLHCDRNNAPPCKDRVYDYLWIGEYVGADVIGAGKEHLPYVVPCMDLQFEKEMTYEMYYAYTIPFLQFPLMKTGRPMLGENLNLPNVTYYGGFEQDLYTRIRDYTRTHPDGPYTHSHWSSIPDDPNEYLLWEKYAKLYKPMVTENSVVYMQLYRYDEILSPLGGKIVASLFVNENAYLVLSNLSNAAYTLKLKSKWRDRQSGVLSDTFTVERKQIIFLEATL